jgi:hypothetical protein
MAPKERREVVLRLVIGFRPIATCRATIVQ